MASWSLDECNAQPDIQAHYQTQFTEEWNEIYSALTHRDLPITWPWPVIVCRLLGKPN